MRDALEPPALVGSPAVVESGMAFEEGMFSIIRSLMYLDGMVLRCNPDARLIEDLGASVSEFRAAM